LSKKEKGRSFSFLIYSIIKDCHDFFYGLSITPLKIAFSELHSTLKKCMMVKKTTLAEVAQNTKET